MSARQTTDELRHIFQNTNDWLKFAEAKNAALVTFNAGSVFGSLSIITDESHDHGLIGIYLLWFCILNVVALLVGLWSFLPKTGAQLWCATRAKREGNIVYYGNIYAFQPEDYLSQVVELTQHVTDARSCLDLDYAEQIIANSRIAVRKYRYFTVSLIVTISSLLILILGVVLRLCHSGV